MYRFFAMLARGYIFPDRQGTLEKTAARENVEMDLSPKDYQKYVKEVPILLPFVPLYSVEKYKWLVA